MNVIMLMEKRLYELSRVKYNVNSIVSLANL